MSGALPDGKGKHGNLAGENTCQKVEQKALPWGHFFLLVVFFLPCEELLLPE